MKLHTVLYTCHVTSDTSDMSTKYSGEKHSTDIFILYHFKVKKCECPSLLEVDIKTNAAQLELNDIETWKCYEIDGYEGILSYAF